MECLPNHGTPARLVAVLLGVAGALAMSACASNDTASTTARAPVYERADTPTGSNLPRKANKPSNVQVVDPEAMQGASRGATRNPGTGP